MCILTLLVKDTSSSTGEHDAVKKPGTENLLKPLIQNLPKIEVKGGTITMFAAEVHYVTLDITKQVFKMTRTKLLLFTH